MVVTNVKRFLIYCWHVLAREQMPVWLSLIILVVGVWGTYIVSPMLNAQFETAKLKSAYILDNLKALNQETGELFSVVGRVNRNAMDKATISQSDIDKLYEIITKLQWRAFEYKVTIPGEDAGKKIDEYVQSLNDLRSSIDSVKKVQDISVVLEKSKKVSKVSAELVNLIARRSEIRLSDNK